MRNEFVKEFKDFMSMNGMNYDDCQFIVKTGKIEKITKLWFEMFIDELDCKKGAAQKWTKNQQYYDMEIYGHLPARNCFLIVDGNDKTVVFYLYKPYSHHYSWKIHDPEPAPEWHAWISDLKNLNLQNLTFPEKDFEGFCELWTNFELGGLTKEKFLNRS